MRKEEEEMLLRSAVKFVVARCHGDCQGSHDTNRNR